MPLAVLTAVYIALFGYYLQRNIIVQPYWDMYSHVLRYLQFREDGNWWAYLWEPHVQHRNVWMRLLTAFDAEVFAGVAYPFIVTAAACMLGAAWLLWRETRTLAAPELRRTIGMFVLMLVLTAVAAVDCALPIDGIYPQALLFTVLALVLFDGTGDFEPPHRQRIGWRRALAVVAAGAAPFANAAALTLWPILIWIAWRVRAGRSWIVGLVAVAAVFTATYLYDLPLEGQRGLGVVDDGSHMTADRLLRMADYVVTYLGLPWTRAAALSTAGRIVGALLFGAGLYAVVHYGVIRQSIARLERIAVGLIMFSMATALLAAFGRIDVDREVLVPVRYSVFVAPLHVGLLWLSCPYLVRHWSIPKRRHILKTLAVIAAALLLLQQVGAGETAAATTAAMRETIRRFNAGETEPDMARVIFDNLEQARRSWTTIQQAGLYSDR